MPNAQRPLANGQRQRTCPMLYRFLQITLNFGIDSSVPELKSKAVHMRKLVRHAAAVVFTLVAIQPWQFAQAQQADQPALHGYQKAPQPISDILSSRPTPLVQLSPDGKWLLAIERLGNPPISDLAQPMLRLAGLRINPSTNGRHHPPRLVALSLVEVATGKTRKVTGLPANPYLNLPDWSPDGTKFAFTNTVADGIELWVGNVET